jgi:hypothetical protein
MLQVSIVFESDRHRIRELDRQAVLQRGADQVFRAEERAGVYEKDMVGQVSQARAQEEGLHQEQPIVLIPCPPRCTL